MHGIVSSCANHISRYICHQKHSKTGMTVVTRGKKIKIAQTDEWEGVHDGFNSKKSY